MKISITYIIIFMLLTGIGLGVVWHKLNHIEILDIQFSITLSGEEGDFFVLYHRTKNQIFSIEKRIKRRIVGDGVLRTLDYQLPAGTTNVRIDLSQKIQEAKGSSKILKDEQLRSLRFNNYCHNFQSSEKGLWFNTRTIGARYKPRIDDLNLPYLLYYTR